MPLYAVIFADNDEYASERTRLMPEHLRFLSTNSQHIRAAGPLRDASSGIAAGGLWITQADSVSEIQQLIERDPFWPTGLRQSVKVLEWTQVFAHGQQQTESAET